MRLYEFSGSKSPIESSLIGILNFLRYRGHDFKAPLDISTNELISMVQKTGVPFTYDSLVQANNSKAVQNLISSFDKDTVQVRPIGDEFDKSEKVVNKGGDEPEPGGDPMQEPMGADPMQTPAPDPMQQPQPGDPNHPEQLRRDNRVDQMAKRALSRRQ